MAALPKKLLRSLPTLTEVVTPPVLSDPVQAADPPPPLLDSDAIIDRVLQRLDVSLEERVRHVIDTLVQEHIREIEPRLKQKVGVAVRAAVTKAVSAEVKEQRTKLK
jgi:hypothetical protein